MISGLITGTLDQQNGTNDGDETRFAGIGQTRHWSKPVLFVGRLVWLQPAMGGAGKKYFLGWDLATCHDQWRHNLLHHC